jgi:hypothetical protein
LRHVGREEFKMAKENIFGKIMKEVGVKKMEALKREIKRYKEYISKIQDSTPVSRVFDGGTKKFSLALKLLNSLEAGELTIGDLERFIVSDCAFCNKYFCRRCPVYRECRDNSNSLNLQLKRSIEAYKNQEGQREEGIQRIRLVLGRILDYLQKRKQEVLGK